MKYLLFVYYSEGEKTEDEIHQIATELSPIVDSDAIKYVYGPAHVVFNFMTEMSIDELSTYVEIITEDTMYFKYIIIPTPKVIASNMEPEHLGHLMDVYGENEEDGETSPNFIEFLKESFEATNPNICSLTIDEILEKIKQTGVGSLSAQEKEKLDNYSQSIQN
jgi:hypothetical protein